MINKKYRLNWIRNISVDFADESLEGEEVIVRPRFMSICRADQRYYTGSRPVEILEKKLPMSLIHEAVGEVVYDPKNEFKVGDTVVLIPNTPTEANDTIKENYLRSSKFRGSGFDGFMQEIVKIQRDRLVKFRNIKLEIASLLELISVIMNALEAFNLKSHRIKETIGIWGDGSVGFIAALILKKKYPTAKVILFGVREEKMNYFTFVDESYNINHIPIDLKVDHAFECVGGSKSERAINQIIDMINPQGVISLLGVSEENVPINTRMILEKGLTLIGNSRSSKTDFEEAIAFLEENEDAQYYLGTIISEIINVRDLNDVYDAFDKDLNNDFKTVMKWEI